MKTILLVDDEFGIATVLASLLEEEGHQVLVAANGRQALGRLTGAAVVPDLVITDFMMPLLDGAGLGKALRADPAWRTIPIIVISAVSEASVKREFADYDAFLRKPFSIPLFVERVTALLAGDGATSGSPTRPTPSGPSPG